jgi:hypothetical protein
MISRQNGQGTPAVVRNSDRRRRPATHAAHAACPHGSKRTSASTSAKQMRQAASSATPPRAAAAEGCGAAAACAAPHAGGGAASATLSSGTTTGGVCGRAAAWGCAGAASAGRSPHRPSTTLCTNATPRCSFSLEGAMRNTYRLAALRRFASCAAARDRVSARRWREARVPSRLQVRLELQHAAARLAQQASLVFAARPNELVKPGVARHLRVRRHRQHHALVEHLRRHPAGARRRPARVTGARHTLDGLPRRAVRAKRREGRGSDHT